MVARGEIRPPDQTADDPAPPTPPPAINPSKFSVKFVEECDDEIAGDAVEEGEEAEEEEEDDYEPEKGRNPQIAPASVLMQLRVACLLRCSFATSPFSHLSTGLDGLPSPSPLCPLWRISLSLSLHDTIVHPTE